MQYRTITQYNCTKQCSQNNYSTTVQNSAVQNNLYINLACLSVCLFVSNKCQNGWTDRAQIFCGTSRDPREGLWMIEILNICLHQNSIFIIFWKFWKSTKFFCENPRIIFVLFYDVHKENMFTINLEDGREAPSKASYNTIVQKSALQNNYSTTVQNIALQNIYSTVRTTIIPIKKGGLPNSVYWFLDSYYCPRPPLLLEYFFLPKVNYFNFSHECAHWPTSFLEDETRHFYWGKNTIFFPKKKVSLVFLCEQKPAD